MHVGHREIRNARQHRANIQDVKRSSLILWSFSQNTPIGGPSKIILAFARSSEMTPFKTLETIVKRDYHSLILRPSLTTSCLSVR